VSSSDTALECSRLVALGGAFHAGEEREDGEGGPGRHLGRHTEVKVKVAESKIGKVASHE